MTQADRGEGLPVPRKPALLASAVRMAERRQHRENAGQDARSERPATGHGETEAGLGDLPAGHEARRMRAHGYALRSDAIILAIRRS